MRYSVSGREKDLSKLSLSRCCTKAKVISSESHKLALKDDKNEGFSSDVRKQVKPSTPDILYPASQRQRKLPGVLAQWPFMKSHISLASHSSTSATSTSDIRKRVPLTLHIQHGQTKLVAGVSVHRGRSQLHRKWSQLVSHRFRAYIKTL